MNKGAFSIPRYSKLSLKGNIIYHIPQSGRGNSTIIFEPKPFAYLSSLVRDRLSYACSIRETDACDICNLSAISSCVNPSSSLRRLSISATWLFNLSFKPGLLLCLYPGRIFNRLNHLLTVVKNYFCVVIIPTWNIRNLLRFLFYRKSQSILAAIFWIALDFFFTFFLPYFYFEVPTLFNGGFWK